MSASPAAVAAVQQAMTAHLADFDIEVAAQRCRCGLVVGDSVQAEAHRAEMVAAAAEAAALEAAAEVWSDWDALNAPEDWLRERAEAVRS